MSGRGRRVLPLRARACELVQSRPLGDSDQQWFIPFDLVIPLRGIDPGEEFMQKAKCMEEEVQEDPVCGGENWQIPSHGQSWFHQGIPSPSHP